MEAKILNFTDAMKLSQIISRHIDMELIKGMAGDEFACEIFSKLDEIETVSLVEILNIDMSGSPKDIILLSVVAMIENNLLDLLSVYKQLGFVQ